MNLLCVQYPFALVESDNGDILVAQSGEEFHPIRIPIGLGDEANLSRDSIKNMTFRMSLDSDTLTLPVDQYEAAVDRAIPSDVDAVAARAVKDVLYSLFGEDLEKVHDAAERLVHESNEESIPFLLEIMHTDDNTTFDHVVDFIMKNTHVLYRNEVRNILLDRYNDWFELG